MKKLYITTIVILILSILLLLFYKHNDNFWSQNHIEISNQIDHNNGISNELSNLLGLKQAIKSIEEAHLIVYKAEKRVDFFVTDSTPTNYLILTEQIGLSSNINGTKLYDSDINIPEGNYQIESFTSKDITRLPLNFPNKFDIDKQKADRRPPLTSEISLGVSDHNIQLDSITFSKILLISELISPKKIGITIVPNDFKNGKAIPFCMTCPPWIEELYGSLRLSLKEFE